MLRDRGKGSDTLDDVCRDVSSYVPERTDVERSLFLLRGLEAISLCESIWEESLFRGRIIVLLDLLTRILLPIAGYVINRAESEYFRMAESHPNSPSTPMQHEVRERLRQAGDQVLQNWSEQRLQSQEERQEQQQMEQERHRQEGEPVIQNWANLCLHGQEERRRQWQQTVTGPQDEESRAIREAARHRLAEQRKIEREAIRQQRLRMRFEQEEEQRREQAEIIRQQEEERRRQHEERIRRQEEERERHPTPRRYVSGWRDTA